MEQRLKKVFGICLHCGSVIPGQSGLLGRLATGMFEEVGIDLVGDAVSRGRSPLSPPVPVGKGGSKWSVDIRG